MKLRSLHITPAHDKGWTSRHLEFGTSATQLFGPNGCGKTPLLQSIAYALGMPVSFRDDIKRNCKAVVLTVSASGRELTITRAMSNSFSVEVQEGQGKLNFYNEADYSRFLLGTWRIGDPAITSNEGKEAHLYLAHVLPIFYLDQSQGYTAQYYSSSKFIKDQYAEVMRSVFCIAPKNPFGRKRLISDLKEKIDLADRDVTRSQKLIAQLSAEIRNPAKSIEEIDVEVGEAERILESLRTGANARDEEESALDTMLQRLQLGASRLRQEKAELNARIGGINQIVHEIETEANTLSLNEEARRLFSSFSAICANTGCGLFLNSAESYGKSLLYLRDQLKDLERQSELHKARARSTDEALGSIGKEIEELKARRAKTQHRTEVTALIETVSMATESLVRLRRERQLAVELGEEERHYVERLGIREELLNQLSSVSAAPGTTDLELLRIRNTMQTAISKWLSILSTPNVSPDVQVDADFNVTFGGEKIRQFSGSTLTRIILAIRTATFEMLTERPEFSPRFLILDTPRQQDISREDLAKYVSALKELSIKQSIQIVFSSSNYEYQKGEGDVDWHPDFPGEEQPMFLGSANDPSRSEPVAHQ